MVTIDQREDPGLTRREREVLQFVASGLSAKQVAQEIGIAPRTVERHIENLRHKMRARNKTHMIAKAVALGELQLQKQADGDAEQPGLFGSLRLVSGR